MAIPRKGTYYKTHARYYCTCVEKKTQTSKRVSIAAPPRQCDFKRAVCDASPGRVYLVAFGNDMPEA